MINTRSVTVHQNSIPAGNIGSSKAAGISFTEYLAAASDNAEAYVPDKWCLETDKFGTGVDKAVRYMRENLGLDPESRTPTYEITDKQLQWLSSRHDLSNIYKTETGTCGDGCCGWTMSWWDENFLSDLVYLNVISPDDAKGFGKIAFPKSESGMVHAVSDSGGSDSGSFSIADAAARVLKTQQGYIDAIYEKYKNNLSLMLKQDQEYLETAQKLLEKNRIWYEILMRVSD
ncbi:MAG: hypothetical protein NC394_09140 [Bacteroides sp.]|nr:hypothetical protein [Bacteroides sp.]